MFFKEKRRVSILKTGDKRGGYDDGWEKITNLDSLTPQVPWPEQELGQAALAPAMSEAATISLEYILIVVN